MPAKRVDIVYRDLTKPDTPFDVLVWGLDSRFSAIYVKGAWYVKTDYKAPNGRILKADPGIMPDVWQTIVPEGPDSNRRLLHRGRQDLRQAAQGREDRDSRPTRSTASRPAQSSSTASARPPSSTGRSMDRYGFFSFESFIVPPTIYRLDTVTGHREVFAQPKIPFDSSQYELRQVFYTSKDGTRIPMFIAGKKGLKQDGTERLLMTGYGGFDLSELPEWNPVYAWWLEQGGWFALPNLRGGGEYGEKWHEQGMLLNKQNVFDDLFAAAEYLIANKYTSPAALRHHGPLQRRAADGRRHHPAARSVFGCRVRLSPA